MGRSVEDTLVVRMEASLAKFERQMERGRRSAETSALGSEKAWKKAGNQIHANANHATTGISRMTNVSSRGRFVLQNTTAQISDMAVQLEMGTSASRVMSQQLPQLFGGLGALGGVLGVLGPLMGTVAALGIPLAAAFLLTGDESLSLEEKFKSLTKSVSELQSAQETAINSPLDMVAKYGDLAGEAQEIFEVNREIASVRAQAALDRAARGIAGQLGIEGVFGFGANDVRELEQTIIELKQAQIDALAVSLGRTGASAEEMDAASRQIEEINDKIKDLKRVAGNADDLATALGITEDAAREVAAQFANIGQAKGPRAQAQAMNNLVDYIVGASNNLARASDEGESFVDQLRQALVRALELTAIDIANPVRDGIEAVGELTQEFWNAVSAKNALEGKGVTGGRGGDPRKLENDPYWSARYFPDPERPQRKKSGRRGSSVDSGLKEAQRLYDETRTSAEQYSAELERINALHREFPEIITTEVKDRAIKVLNESAGKLSDTATTLERSLESVFATIVSGSGDAKSAIQGLIAQLAKMATHSLVRSLGIGDFFDGLFGGEFANGGVFSRGHVTPFATGGVVSTPTMFPMANGMGLMGEAGPEAIMPLSRGSNGKLGVSAVGGQQSSLHVTVSIQDNGNLGAFVRNEAGKIVAQSVPTISDMQRRQTGSNNQNFFDRES